MERVVAYLPSSLRAWMEALHTEPRVSTVHKPALLLVVLDRIDEGFVDPSRVAPDEALTRAFDALLARAPIAAPRGAAWQPFFHLGTTKIGRTPFWTLHDARGTPLRADASESPGTLRRLRERVAYASFAPALAGPLRSAADREAIRGLLYEWLERRPDANALRLVAAHDRDWPLVQESASLVRETTRPFELHVSRPLVELSERMTRVRARGFRMGVLPYYEHRCAACELRLRLGELYEAEAAHIVPVQSEGPDDVRNALSLCRTHHWAFDAGLWTVDASRRIAVFDGGDRDDVDVTALRPLQGRTLQVPSDDAVAPHPRAFAWHRKHTFAGARAA